jgi:transcriptional repressor NrdR
MFCPNCLNPDTKVIDSRLSEDWKSTRRRRECEKCGNRFTTYEKLEILDLIVLKSGDRKQRYDREKLEDSILKAVNKRNISIADIRDIIKDLEFKWSSKQEISSKEIWKWVLESLLRLDEVAYIRYASVHLNFETASDFINFINKKKIKNS